jgi:hypothetical protein
VKGIERNSVRRDTIHPQKRRHELVAKCVFGNGVAMVLRAALIVATSHQSVAVVSWEFLTTNPASG